MRIVLLVTTLALISGPVAAQSPAPPGALTCSGCHGAAGSELPSLRGKDAATITQALLAFRSGAREATLMNRITKGFSEDELAAIAVWIEAQKDVK